MGANSVLSRVSRGANPTEVGCYHYSSLSEVPWDLQKYFYQRHTLFSKYDDGIWMTENAWYGVTPEPVARAVAKFVDDAAPQGKTIIVDCFAGVGGNTIAFAQQDRWTEVHAIENDMQTLQCAKHNANVYGVAEKITWHHGDFEEVIKRGLGPCTKVIVFASPPWGGPSYRSSGVFDLSTMQPYNLHYLIDALKPLSDDIVLYLPRTCDIEQLMPYAQDDCKVPVIHFCVEGASKAACCFLGPTFQIQAALSD